MCRLPEGYGNMARQYILSLGSAAPEAVAASSTLGRQWASARRFTSVLSSSCKKTSDLIASCSFGTSKSSHPSSRLAEERPTRRREAPHQQTHPHRGPQRNSPKQGLLGFRQATGVRKGAWLCFDRGKGRLQRRWRFLWSIVGYLCYIILICDIRRS